MPQTSLLFSTFGTWDNTNLVNNGTDEIDAARLFIHLITDGRHGVRNGGEITAYVTTQDALDQQVGLIPGRFEADIHSPACGENNIVIENYDPTAEFRALQVTFNGLDVTDTVHELYLEVDYPQNIVSGYLRLVKRHLLGDGLDTVNLL